MVSLLLDRSAVAMHHCLNLADQTAVSGRLINEIPTFKFTSMFPVQLAPDTRVWQLYELERINH